MKRAAWFPRDRAKQLVVFTNVKSKIATHAAALGIDAPTLARIILICDTFIAVDAYVQQSSATNKALKDWRDSVYEDENAGDTTPPPPFSTFVEPVGMFSGIFDEFRKEVDQWKSADGYTLAIGEDLTIVGVEEPPVPENISPEIGIEPKPNYSARITGKMKGMSAVRVEYRRKGGPAYLNVGTLQSCPPIFRFSRKPRANPNRDICDSFTFRKTSRSATIRPIIRSRSPSKNVWSVDSVSVSVNSVVFPKRLKFFTTEFTERKTLKRGLFRQPRSGRRNKNKRTLTVRFPTRRRILRRREGRTAR